MYFKVLRFHCSSDIFYCCASLSAIMTIICKACRRFSILVLLISFHLLNADCFGFNISIKIWDIQNSILISSLFLSYTILFSIFCKLITIIVFEDIRQTKLVLNTITCIHCDLKMNERYSLQIKSEFLPISSRAFMFPSRYLVFND